jgi:hypothetical protein
MYFISKGQANLDSGGQTHPRKLLYVLRESAAPNSYEAGQNRALKQSKHKKL